MYVGMVFLFCIISSSIWFLFCCISVAVKSYFLLFISIPIRGWFNHLSHKYQFIFLTLQFYFFSFYKIENHNYIFPLYCSMFNIISFFLHSVLLAYSNANVSLGLIFWWIYFFGHTKPSFRNLAIHFTIYCESECHSLPSKCT